MDNSEKIILNKFLKIANLEVKKFADFFKVPPPFFKLKLARNRDEFNRLAKIETSEPWLAGMFLAGKPAKIILLHPVAVEKEGIHFKEDLEKILKHEVAHLVFNEVYPLSQPAWLKEGVSVYLAGQTKRANFNLKFFSENGTFPLSLTTEEEWKRARKFGAYGISGKFIKFLVKRDEGEKLRFFIQKLPKENYNKEQFLQIFKEVFKTPLVLIAQDFLKNLRKEVRKNECRTKARNPSGIRLC